MALEITNTNDLLAMRFILQPATNDQEPLFKLELNSTFYLTVYQGDMILQLNVVNQGMIQKLDHIKNTVQINELIYSLTGLRSSCLENIVNRLQGISKFNLTTYRIGEYDTETERHYSVDGDLIDAYEVDDIISEFGYGNISDIVTR